MLREPSSVKKRMRSVPGKVVADAGGPVGKPDGGDAASAEGVGPTHL